MKNSKKILWFKEVSKKDVPRVGGKNASLGEMMSQLKGVKIPDGFCLTSQAYWYFLEENKIKNEIKKIIESYKDGDLDSLKETSRKIKKIIRKSDFPEDLRREIEKNYKKLSSEAGSSNIDVAVRSSATAEDSLEASFAGQHETFLNVRGREDLLKAIKDCIASMFNQRAIAYREEKGFNHLDIAISVGIQRMVRSDKSSSGVMFSLDTESGFDKVVLINSIWGVGEMIVKGEITPDSFYVFKPFLGKKKYNPIIVKNLGRKNKKYIYNKEGGLKEVKVKIENKFSLKDEEILTLAKWAVKIEKHYGIPQDIEWAKDGKTGELFIVQSRPETVHSAEKNSFYKEYELEVDKKPILSGTAIGDKIGFGPAKITVNVSQAGKFKKGDVLVTKMTNPDWVPIMRLASAIITEEGGKTCHAAIVARELGIPTIVGAEKASRILKDGEEITVDCTQGLDGRIFSGRVPFKVKEYDLSKIPDLKTKIMINIAAPDIAFKTSFLPNDGVGLAREEFIIAEKIKVHPLALLNFNKIKDKSLRKKIEEITREYGNKKEYFIKELAEGIGQIAAAFWPKEVIVRFSDFKTNEYRKLIGGELFEPEESNPMIGWRGASRYYDKKFKKAFLMECQAIKRVREVFGLNNVNLMIPFCRTVAEGKKVLKVMKEGGLKKGKLKVYVMCEIPSNVALAERFLDVFDGMSIGSNDLTQLTLGIDRDNASIQNIGNEKDEAVKNMIKKTIEICRRRKKYCGICGQAPSDFPEFAHFLQENKIESISLNPDSVIKTMLKLK